MNATDTPEQRAIDRSKAIDPDLGRVSRVASGEYLVLGNHDWRTVRVDASGYRCSCEAGVHGRRCWHVGSVYRMRLACRSIRPAATVKPLTGAQAKRDLWG